MAAYSIVLNLSGNAVTRVEKLAAALATANANAAKLAASLGAVGAVGRSMPIYRMPPSVSPRVYPMSPGGGGHISQNTPRRYGGMLYMNRYLRQMFTLFPPSDGVMRAANVASIATELVKKAGMTALKVVGASSVAPIAIGGGGLMLALRALQSESFAEGVRLISRRHQARMGLGAEYEAAERNVDYLAASYGLDRSTSLSSVNVLTGLRAGSTGIRFGLSDATRLTQTGGLISQHHGVPFERVMTNIQQLMVQQTPHMRDIRELLNQAPILGKYAIKEMEGKGVTGKSSMEYLKDQRNILSVLESYRLDIATNAGMQARGKIALAQQDAWARVAGNDPAWRYFGNAGAGVINSMGTAANNLLTMLSENDAFKVMVKQVEFMFDNLGNKGTEFIDKLITFIERVADKFDIDLGNKEKAKLENDRASALETLVTDPTFRSQAFLRYESLGLLNGLTPEVRRKKESELLREDVERLKSAPEWFISQFVVGVGKLVDKNTAHPVSNTFLNRANANERSIDFATTVQHDPLTQSRFYPVTGMVRGYASHSTEAWLGKGFSLGDPSTWLTSKRGMLANPNNAYALYLLQHAPMLDYITDARNNQSTQDVRNTLDLTKYGAKSPNGEDLTGVNRDRRSLTINFNAPIAEVTNHMQTSDPREAGETILENANLTIAEGIQKALLGATGKMNSRFI